MDSKTVEATNVDESMTFVSSSYHPHEGMANTSGNSLEQSQGRSPQWCAPEILSILLRLVTCAAAWTAFSLVITGNETRTLSMGLLQMTKQAKWQYSSTFVFHVYVSRFVGSFSLLTMVIAIVVAWKGSKPRTLLWGMFLLDLVLGYLQMAAVGATMAVSLIGKHGNKHTDWMPICGVFVFFCNRMQWSLIAAGIAFLTLADSTILDVYNLFVYRVPAPKDFTVESA